MKIVSHTPTELVFEDSSAISQSVYIVLEVCILVFLLYSFIVLEKTLPVLLILSVLGVILGFLIVSNFFRIDKIIVTINKQKKEIVVFKRVSFSTSTVRIPLDDVASVQLRQNWRIAFVSGDSLGWFKVFFVHRNGEITRINLLSFRLANYTYGYSTTPFISSLKVAREIAEFLGVPFDLDKRLTSWLK